MASNNFKKMKYLYHKKDNFIAYHKIEGKSPGIIFLHGLRSDMYGNKALALEKYAKTKGLSFIRFDFRGHGKSSGHFHNFGITDWIEDMLFILDQLTVSPQILVGSSMGGWIMLQTAIKNPIKIHALLGIAAAPDFTQDIYKYDLSELQKKNLKKYGYIKVKSDYDEEPYKISTNLLNQGEENLLLDNLISINCPIHLLHGELDYVVPIKTALKLMDKLSSKNKKLTILGGAGHRFSEEKEIKEIFLSLNKLRKT